MDPSRLPRLPKSLQLISQLSPEDVSQAWAYLASLPEPSQFNPEPESPLPPSSLRHLTSGDWFLLSNLLLQELHQRETQLLH